jgi:hypothetical protein
MDKPTQKTPKGAEIPVPTRKEWDKVLDKAAKPKGSTTDGPKKK